jgi:hypothetical protein
MRCRAFRRPDLFIITESKVVVMWRVVPIQSRAVGSCVQAVHRALGYDHRLLSRSQIGHPISPLQHVLSTSVSHVMPLMTVATISNGAFVTRRAPDARPWCTRRRC